MIEIVPYKGWQNNLRLTNGNATLIATLDIGPRILSYTANDGPNPLKNNDDQMGGSGEADWKIRGGHRLWIAPEDRVTTYFPDNAPVAWEKLDDLGVRLTPPPEHANGIQKEIDITLDPRGSGATLLHRITNISTAPLTLAPWALTVMTSGGIGVIPQPPLGEHPRDLLPNRTAILWPYTDLSDPRWHLGPDYILLRQDTTRGPTKIGLSHKPGWCGYYVDGVFFLKKFAWQDGAEYPDNGCNLEVFTNTKMMELESLAPLTRLAPGQTAEHSERWELHDARDADPARLPQWLSARQPWTTAK